MENKYALYICPYCKEAHETPGGLAHCILDCEEKKKIEEEKAKKAKLESEKAERKQEVDDAFQNYKKLLVAYMDDYGIYSFKSDDDFDIFNSKFWNLII